MMYFISVKTNSHHLPRLFSGMKKELDVFECINFKENKRLHDSS